MREISAKVRDLIRSDKDMTRELRPESESPSLLHDLELGVRLLSQQLVVQLIFFQSHSAPKLR